MRITLWLLLTGCSSRPLYLPETSPDLAVPPDLAEGDLADAPDLSGAPDLATRDLAPNPTPDLAPSCSPAPVLTERRPYALHDLAAGDFDGDGHQDFVVTSVADVYGPAARREWTVWSGDGLGGFAVSRRSVMSGQPNAILAGDFDGDGRDDLALHLSGEGLELWRGDSQTKLVRTGLIALNDPFSSPIDHGRIEWADVTGDGVKDLVTASENFLWTVPGQAGGFGAPRSTAIAARSRFALGDFDEDGKLDAVTSEHGLSLRRGAGDGGFGAPSGADHSEWITSLLTPLDYDGDGHLDVIVDAYQNGSQRVFVLLGRGDGTFADATDWTRPCTARRLVDLDGDGQLEMVSVPMVPASHRSLATVWRHGAAGWSDEQLFDMQSDDTELALADFDEDGHPDLLLARFDSGSLYLIRERSLSTLEPISEGAGPTDVVVADFDGDGLFDTVVGNYFGTDLRLRRAGGVLSEPVSLDHRWGRALFAGDLDEDGHPDLVVISASWVGGDPQVTLILRWNPAANAFAPAESFRPDHDQPLAVADLDGDGHLDILQSNRNVWDEAYFSRGRGDGTFDAPLTLARDRMGWELALEDSDHDGTFDHFSTLQRPDLMLSVFADARWLDVDGDGEEDAVYGFSDTHEIQVRLGRAGHMLSAPIDSPGCGAYSVAAGDLDGDGHPDVVTSDYHGIRWCRGQGNGRFVFAGLLSADLDFDQLWISDLDGDGCPDVVGVEMTENTYSVISCVAECRSP